MPAFEAARDPVRAGAAGAYMRHRFPFLGIPAPRVAAIAREVTAGLPPPAGDDALAAVALYCWRLPEREYQFFGVWYVRRHVRHAGPAFVPTLERLVTTRPWWDTVDGLATHVAGPLVAAYPELTAVMDRWVESEDLWLARAAILHRWLGDGGAVAGRSRRRVHPCRPGPCLARRSRWKRAPGA
ncbi:MAG TPA: DNA alkylation repair protein, partial [Candidatus Eisenbacteria bacterium]|nr:DNA alkylation repair protein [Candidatus Eisenbacteria bacterium]